MTVGIFRVAVHQFKKPENYFVSVIFDNDQITRTDLTALQMAQLMQKMPKAVFFETDVSSEAIKQALEKLEWVIVGSDDPPSPEMEKIEQLVQRLLDGSVPGADFKEEDVLSVDDLFVEGMSYLAGGLRQVGNAMGKFANALNPFS